MATATTSSSPVRSTPKTFHVSLRGCQTPGGVHEGVLHVVSSDSALVHPLDGVPDVGNASRPGEPADVGEGLGGVTGRI